MGICSLILTLLVYTSEALYYQSTTFNFYVLFPCVINGKKSFVLLQLLIIWLLECRLIIRSSGVHSSLNTLRTLVFASAPPWIWPSHLRWKCWASENGWWYAQETSSQGEGWVIPPLALFCLGSLIKIFDDEKKTEKNDNQRTLSILLYTSSLNFWGKGNEVTIIF